MKRRVLATLCVGVALVGCASPSAVPNAATGRPSGPAATASSAPALPLMTPEATIAAEPVGWLVSDGKSIWVLSTLGQVIRIDPATNRVIQAIWADRDFHGGGFAVTTAGAWVGDFDQDLEFRVDLTSGKVVASIGVGPNPDGLGGDAAGVWVANHRGGSVARIDPATNTVVATVAAGLPGPGGPHEIGIGLGSVWVSAGLSGTVVRIDPRTNKIQATIDIAPGANPCGGFAMDEQAVWMPSCGDDKKLTRIDPKTNQDIATIDLGGYGMNPVLIAGAPWLVVTDTDPATGPSRIVRINPATNQIDREFSLGDMFKNSNTGLVLAFGSVWVGDWDNNQVLRLPLSAFN